MLLTVSPGRTTWMPARTGARDGLATGLPGASADWIAALVPAGTRRRYGPPGGVTPCTSTGLRPRSVSVDIPDVLATVLRCVDGGTETNSMAAGAWAPTSNP